MACDAGEFGSIEACRTCGVYYMSNSNYLKPLFQSAVVSPEILLIRMELAQWKIEIKERDGLPQYVCSTCIHEFQKVFKFRTACLDSQDQLRALYKIREQNLANVKIKTEIPDTNTDNTPRYDFIYVDDLSDGEYDSVTPFNYPHMPIKEELIEAATVPQEDDQSKPVCMAESASAGGTDETIPYTPMAPQHQPAAATTTTAYVLAEEMQKTVNVDYDLCYQNSSSSEEHKKKSRCFQEDHYTECHICGKVFKNTTQDRFKFHLKWHNLHKHAKCPQCKFIGNSRQALKRHKQAVHTKVYCKICGKGVLAKKMKVHLSGHDITAQYPCEYCAEVLSSEKERDNHAWQVHANRNSPDKHQDTNDSQCAFNAEEEESTESYDEVITVGIMCALCDAKFVNCSDLQLHAKLVHFNAAKKGPQIKTEKTEEAERVEQNIQAPSEYMDMSDINSSQIRSNSSFFDDEPLHTTQEDETSDNDQHIAVFEDYDNNEEEESCEQPIDLSNMKDLNTNNKQIYFPQTISNISTAYNLDDCDDDEVIIEHFRPEEHDSQKEDSAADSQTEDDSDTPSIPNEVTQFACAKCTDRFLTIEQLREHYKIHQVVQNKPNLPPSSSSSSKDPKSVFQCLMCDKQFDLKFSLNRHIKKHDNGDAVKKHMR